MNIYYVYYLIDPRNSQPFYVGKGSCERINAHEREARRPISKQYNPKKCKIITDIINCGMSVIKQKIQEGLTESNASLVNITLQVGLCGSIYLNYSFRLLIFPFLYLCYD